MQAPGRTTALMHAPAARAMRCAALLTLVLAAPAVGQDSARAPSAHTGLDGPRFGLTYLSDGIVSTLAKNHIAVGSMITQFGWQLERRIYDGGTGNVDAISEWVVLVGGLDQGLVLPSVSWLVGVRTKGNTELAVGPNVTPAGVALAIAAGYTYRAGALNIPVNVALVPSASGMRVSILTGFNMAR
jgi:hypothetical protein